MEDATAHPLAQLMKTHLKGNIFDPFKTDIVSTLFVYQHYQSTNNLKNTNLKKVAECLEWIGAEKYEQVPLYSAKDGKVGRTNLWVVRNHVVYRSMSKQDLARAYQKQTSERIQTPWFFPATQWWIELLDRRGIYKRLGVYLCGTFYDRSRKKRICTALRV